MEYQETDIAIVGAGPAGLAAAVAAGERGAKVSVFEKTNHIGGLSNGGNGPFGVESRMQHLKHIGLTRKEAFEFFMNFTNWRVDARLVKAYIDKSGNTIDWLESMGVKFIDVVSYYVGAQFTWHYKDPNCGFITDILAKKVKAQGNSIYLNSAVQKIIMKDGGVTGITVKNRTEETININSKAVIIATGGFGGSPEMIKQLTGYIEGLNLFMGGMMTNVTGDGIRMAWEVGAAPGETCMALTASLPPAPHIGAVGPGTPLGAFRQPNLMVNLDGERFINEEVMKDYALTANAINQQKNKCGFVIFDEVTKKYYETHDWDYVMAQIEVTNSRDLDAMLEKAEKVGYNYVFVADSLEEICNRTGIKIERLRTTLDEYNHACETGRDELFHKSSRYLRPIKHPKFYVGQICLSAQGGVGGIKINYKTEVLDKELNVIPGLYAAGTDANTIYSNGTYPYFMCGNFSGFAYNSGRIAGENAAEYVRAAW